MKNKIKIVFTLIALLLCSIIIIGSIYYYNEYPNQEFDAILFMLSTGIEHSSPDVVRSIVLLCITPVLLLFVLLSLPVIKKTNSSLILEIKTKKTTFAWQLFPIKITSSHRIIYTILIFILSLTVLIKCCRIDEYIENRFQETKLFEEYYVDAKNAHLEFPAKKRNLIIIIGESFENTVFSTENGGAWEYSIMPELEKLALNNTSFSNTEKLGGSFETYGTAFSAAGNVAITSGIPLKTTLNINLDNVYTGNGNYLSGVYSIR